MGCGGVRTITSTIGGQDEGTVELMMLYSNTGTCKYVLIGGIILIMSTSFKYVGCKY